MKPLVSVIIPAYNAGATIENCLDSVLNQTYKELEIIVVNDGSVDCTKDILDRYELLDSRIIAISIENSGVSEARNYGLKLASGEFIQFVDSDDWLADIATEKLVDAMLNNCEMVIADYARVYEKSEVIRGDIKLNEVISRTEYALEMMKAPANFYYGVLWNKLYKTDIIRQHNLNFSQKLNWCEDFQFNLEYLQYVKHIYVLQTSIYFYVKTKGSLSSLGTDMKEIVNMKITLFQYYKALYESMDLYEENKIRINRFYIDFARDNIKEVKVVRGVDVPATKKKIYKLRKNTISRTKKILNKEE